jgi:hypothetical protein
MSLFGDRSHNFGPKASPTTDKNLLIINDKKVAKQYAVNIMTVYDHYAGDIRYSKKTLISRA